MNRSTTDTLSEEIVPMGRKRKPKELLDITNRQLFEMFKDHYNKDISQKDIATGYGVSPSTISKIMNDEKHRFVKYVLLDPRHQDLLDIEDRLKERFKNLKKIIIVPGRSDLKDVLEDKLKGKDLYGKKNKKGLPDIILEDVRMQLIIAAADELQHKNLEGKILSLPQGPLVRDIFRLMKPIKSIEAPTKIVTTSGFHGGPANNCNCLYNPSAIVVGPAERVYPNVTERVVIPCPAFLPNGIADKIENEIPIVKDSIEIANEANVLLTGFGSHFYDKSRETFAGVLDERYWPGKSNTDKSQPDYFVGDMAGCLFLARNGNFIDLKTHRVMGLRRQTIEKGDVEIIGVMRPRMNPDGSKEWLWNYISAGKWLSTMIIDSVTADMMLEEIKKHYF